jgi:hypothetical protein
MQALRGEEYSSYSFLTSALGGGGGGQSRLGKRTPQYPLDKRLGGPRSWSGHKRLEKKSFASAGDQTPGHPVHSQTLY